VTYSVPAEATQTQLQELLEALLGGEEDEGAISAAGGRFEFWVGRNGADCGGVRLGSEGVRYCTLGSAAVRSGGGLERTLLVEVATAAGATVVDAAKQA
jgi:hypothetical protein